MNTLTLILKLKKKLINVYQNLKKAQSIKSVEH